MGAKASTEFGSVAISTDKGSYFQGEYLTGTIYLNILKEYQGNEVYFKIKGKEDARWSEGSGKNRRSYHPKKIIISHQFIIFKFNQPHAPLGQFAFPFSLFLAQHLPASFRCSMPDSKVAYKIKGELKSSNKDIKSIRNSHELIIKQAKNEFYAPCLTNLTTNVDIFCCFAQGQTTFEMSVNKTAFMNGEQALVKCVINNSHCDLNLTDVTLTFQKRLILTTTSGHTHTNYDNINTISKTLNIPSRTGTPKVVNFEVLLKRAGLNEKLITSTLGEVVKNHYFLVIHPKYESFCCNCCVKNVETPILIYEPNDAQLAQIQAPENWNPQVMPIQAFNWNQAQGYQGRNQGGYDYPQFDTAKMNEPLIPAGNVNNQMNNYPPQFNQQYVPPQPNNFNQNQGFNQEKGFNFENGQNQGFGGYNNQPGMNQGADPFNRF